jgi:hypothetical protein
MQNVSGVSGYDISTDITNLVRLRVFKEPVEAVVQKWRFTNT